jgi:hypothetical protein
VNAVTKSGIGVAAWGAWGVACWPQWHRHSGAEALVLFAALVLIPLAADLFAEPASMAGGPGRIMNWTGRAQLPAALALGAAYWLPAGAVAALAALPWVGLMGAWAIAGVWRMRRGGWSRDLDWLARDIGLVFAASAGLGVLADRSGLRVPGWDAAAVSQLTVYLHFAGIFLPLFAGLVQRELFFLRLASRAVVGVILGVPALVLGVGVTKAGLGGGIEAGTAGGLALAGMAVGILQVRLAIDARRAFGARVLLAVSGASLFLAMVFVAVWGMRLGGRGRFHSDSPWAQLAFGACLALGFGLCGILAWRRFPAAGEKSPPLG